MKERISIVTGDITTQETDAIVNAANTSLLGGGGVDGAIHRAAGKQLLEECRTLGGCETGGAKITKGYNLKAKYVIHTVGPVWNGGKYGEREKLAGCYKNSLALAEKHKVKSIAFPSISTGIYRFPIEEACRIALKEIKSFLKNNNIMEKVVIVCFDKNTYEEYEKANYEK
ncbi:MAG: O-acetyl-ADP-ribose deacetylase [Ignavibacteriae bacterium]|nr:O-acetyl-ADP-ribose deacetylase [Ignavibacteriota bacterium]